MTKIVLVRGGTVNEELLYTQLAGHPYLRPYVTDLRASTPGLAKKVWASIPRHDPVFVDFAADVNEQCPEGSEPVFDIVECRGRYYHIAKDPKTGKEHLVDESNMIDVTELSTYRSLEFGCSVH